MSQLKVSTRDNQVFSVVLRVVNSFLFRSAPCKKCYCFGCLTNFQTLWNLLGFAIGMKNEFKTDDSNKLSEGPRSIQRSTRGNEMVKASKTIVSFAVKLGNLIEHLDW